MARLSGMRGYERQPHLRHQDAGANLGIEDACVQCGLCRSTCPEKVITLVLRIDFSASRAPARILKEEEPFCCIRCGKPFGVKSSIERVVAQLQGRHWMYTNATKNLDAIKMCEDCRVGFVAEQGFDSFGAGPTVRTTDDYLRERETQAQRPPDDSSE